MRVIHSHCDLTVTVTIDIYVDVLLTQILNIIQIWMSSACFFLQAVSSSVLGLRTDCFASDYMSLSRSYIKTRQAIYMWRNTETRSRYHCCNGKALSSKHVCVCVCVRVYVCRCTSASVWLRTCRITYSVYHAQAPCCLRPVWPQQIFRHYLINSAIFGNKLLYIKWVFWFFLRLLFEMFAILRKFS
jgi:hypothetical protein